MTDINAMCDSAMADSSQAFVGERIDKALSFHVAGATGQQDVNKWEIPMELMDIEEVQAAPKTELAPFEREELDRQRAAAHAEAKRVADETRAQSAAAEAKAKAAADALAAERAELERMRAELEAMQAFIVLPPEPWIEELAKPVEPPTGVTLIQGEVGTVDAGIVIVEGPRAPVASAIVLAVAEFWHTDTKTAARWITERAAEIESLR